MPSEEQRLQLAAAIPAGPSGWLRGRVNRLQSGLPVVAFRILLFDMGLIAAILVLLWASLGFHLLQERRRAFQEAERTASNLAGAAEQVLARTIEAVDQRLLFIREAYRADRLGFSLEFLRKRNGFLDGTTFEVAIISATGQLRMTNLGAVENAVDLSDRPHFRFHFDNLQDELFISVPVLGLESQRWSIQFTRKLHELDGSFAGVVVASIDPNWLTRLYETLDIGKGAMTLVGQDGVVRARAPHLATALGTNIRSTGLLDTVFSQQHGTERMISPLDGVDRVISYRWINPYPLFVLVGCDVTEFSANYAVYRYLTLLTGGGLTILVIIAGFLMLRHKWRQITTQQALSDAIENINQGLILVDKHGRVPVLNRRFQQLLGLPSKLLESCPSFADIVKWQRQTGEFGPSGAAAVQAPLGIQDIPDGVALPGSGILPKAAPVFERTRPDGTVLEIRTQLLPAGGAVRTYADVTERRKAEQRIRFLAHHDMLTGLANRFLLHEQLDKALSAARRTGQTVAVLAMDLDGFKAANDTLGHTTGDLLLKQVATRLLESVRVDDTVARMGGDEFVILQVGTPQPRIAEALAQRLVIRLSEPFSLQGRNVCVGSSIGIALYPQDGATAEDLLRRADMALYCAKSSGKGALRFFQAEMEDRLRDRSLLQQDLRYALSRNEMTIVYQSFFSCSSKQVTGFEALLRWLHPTRGPVSAADFIPLAEESGLIQPIGQWVVEQACAAAASWPGKLRIAVNLSPAQFRSSDLLGVVANALEQAQIPASRLELEVTEGLLIGDSGEALTAMQALKEQGVSLALDDFGTGYASLGYLRRFPFCRLKIDRSFMAGLGRDQQAQAIVEAVLAMAHRLSLKVTAEGVETQEQLDFLCRNGCDEAQGFLLSHPVAADQVVDWLNST